MGIYDFYYQWLKNNTSFSVIFTEKFNKVSSLSIDGNAILHNITQMVYAYGNAYNDLYGKNVGPKKKEDRQRKVETMSDDELFEDVCYLLQNKLLDLVQKVGPTEYFFLA